MRLDKYLADMKIGSRSEVREMIRKGKVTVNGTVLKDAGYSCKDSDEVSVQGKKVSYVSSEYYMLNKPVGVVCATEDRDHPTVLSLVESARKDLFPVGRLDIDTEGLLLLTNDGELSHLLLSPARHVEKTYYLETECRIPEDAVSKIADGIELKPEGKMLPGVLKILSDTSAELTIQEGKYHQVKRTMAICGAPVAYLKRIRMGDVLLDEQLKPGEYRKLTSEELESLKKCACMKRKNK